MKKKTLAFDVYGTLIDTHGVLSLLQTFIGDDALTFSNAWREKQLEYSFRRALMGQYKHFSVCTREALVFVCRKMAIDLSEAQQQALLAHYKTLPAFSDVPASLKRLSTQCNLVAFSNGERESVEGLLTHADIIEFFDDIVTADEINTFKPDPQIYQHLLSRCETDAASTWLISSNPFDIIGARAQSINTAWVQRSEQAVFDAWEIAPHKTVSSLSALFDTI